ncbi:hypothetical protein FDZ73_17205 [bacterium]|nr:MAG: hypothetical protein FDZ73_17205 [bacterium]
MEEQQDANTIQLNLAKFQRNAGRDYNEYFIPSNIKLVLATTPQVELDALAEDNGRMFRYRFGFSATRRVRQQVVALQQTYDLSDSEIRWLKHAGHLRISRADMTIDPSRLMPITGWIQLVIFSIVCIGMVFQVAFSGAPEWKQGLGQTILAAIWFGGASVLLKLYVVPWNTMKRSGVIGT